MTRSTGWGGQMRSGVLWSNASFLATRATSMLALLVLSRLLTPSEFGVVAAVTVYVSLFEVAGDLGMKATVVYEQEHGITRRVQNAFTVNLLISAALTALGLALAPLIADFFRAGDEVGLFRLAALNPLIRGLGNIHDSLLMRDMKFRRRAAPEFAMATVRAAVSIPLALAGLGAQSIVIGFVAGTLTWTVAHWVLTPLKPTFALDRGVVRSMVSYGSQSTAIGVVSAVALRTDQAAIGRVLGDRALGLYSLAFRVPELLIESVSWNLSRVVFPGLSRQRMADQQGLGAATARILHFQSLYALPLAAGVAVMGPPLTVTLFGSQWQAAGGVASAVAVTSGISAVAFPFGDSLKATGRQRTLLLIQTLQLPFYIAVIVLVAPAGILVVAWARAGADLVHLVAVVLAASSGLGERITSFARAVLPGLIAAGGVLVGAGAVRLAWTDLSAGPVLAGAAAGLLSGGLALRLLAPAAFAELGTQLAMLRRSRRAPSAEA